MAWKKKNQKEKQPHELGPPVEFKPQGGSAKENQAKLIGVARPETGRGPIPATSENGG